MVSFTKAEEEALEITTERYRRDNQIPDSDGLAMIMLRDKRGRSETMSTNLSGIPEAVLE
jgi:hypothetical protein